jgi:hypothetical protein
MNWKAFIDLRGLNFWLLASGVILNFIWTFFVLLITLRLLTYDPQGATGVQLGLMVGVFAGAFVAGWGIGKWAGDNRGPTYGLIGGLGSAGPILFVMLPAGGVLGLLAAAMALFGGLNGGLVSLKRRN